MSVTRQLVHEQLLYSEALLTNNEQPPQCFLALHVTTK